MFAKDLGNPEDIRPRSIDGCVGIIGDLKDLMREITNVDGGGAQPEGRHHFRPVLADRSYRRSDAGEGCMTALSILVVDDDPDLAESIAEALSLAGQNVRIAGNGAEAVQHYKETKYDLGFLDIRMPVMNGVDCIFAVRERYPDAKIALMTCFKEVTVEQALAAGALALLHKPFRMEDLIKIACQNS